MILWSQAVLAVIVKRYFCSSRGFLEQHDMEQHGYTHGHA